MRPTLHQWAMDIALVTRRRATCARRQVGCVLLNERGHILATGYNGVAAGLPHCTDQNCPGAGLPSGQGLESCQAIHAEQNALLQCPDVYKIHTAIVTTAPCVTCTKLFLNTSCQRIVYFEDYPQAEAAKKLWVSAGRLWEVLP